MFRKGLVASLGVAMAMLSLPPVHAAPLEPKQYGDFDRYVLALSWQTGFCQSQHDHGGREPEECRLQKELPQKIDFLTVHGLWPGLPNAVWMRSAGCDMAAPRALFPICLRRKSARNVLPLKPECHWKWRTSSTRLCPALAARLVLNVTNMPNTAFASVSIRTPYSGRWCV